MRTSRCYSVPSLVHGALGFFFIKTDSWDHTWRSPEVHPELKSRPFAPHPLFAGFFGATISKNKQEKKAALGMLYLSGTVVCRRRTGVPFFWPNQ
jgi:hypothetical protein